MKKRHNTIYGYNDSFFLRSTLAVLNDIFDGNVDYLHITMKMTLHDVIFYALHDAGLLPGIVFHGGTCLQRMYDCPRFSEDLDFANISTLTPNIFTDFSRDFGWAIRSRLKTLGFSDEQMTVKEPGNLAWPAEKEPAVRRWAMRVVVDPRGRKQVVNVELANMPSYDYSLKPFVPLSAAIVPGRVEVNVEPLNVIFNDKIISIIQRPYTKYRDIYDVGFLSQRHTYGSVAQSVDRDLFCQKMADREFTPEYVLGRIGEVREILLSEEAVTGFSREMSRFVIPGRTEDVADIEVARNFISRSLDILDEIEDLMRERQEESHLPGPR